MCVQVVEEGDRDDAPDGDTLVYGQDQERQPGHQGDGDQAAHQEVQGGPRRVQAAPELVEGTAEDEGEVLLRFREKRPGVGVRFISSRRSRRCPRRLEDSR